jgi:hypothetical protein
VGTIQFSLTKVIDLPGLENFEAFLVYHGSMPFYVGNYIVEIPVYSSSIFYLIHKLGYTLSLLFPLERASTHLATIIVSRIT